MQKMTVGCDKWQCHKLYCIYMGSKYMGSKMLSAPFYWNFFCFHARKQNAAQRGRPVLVTISHFYQGCEIRDVIYVSLNLQSCQPTHSKKVKSWLGRSFLCGVHMLSLC